MPKKKVKKKVAKKAPIKPVIASIKPLEPQCILDARPLLESALDRQLRAFKNSALTVNVENAYKMAIIIQTLRGYND